MSLLPAADEKKPRGLEAGGAGRVGAVVAQRVAIGGTSRLTEPVNN